MPEIEIPLIGGLDEKSARKLIQPGSFLDLVNARFDKDGQISQRFGVVSLTTNDLSGAEITALRAGHGYRGSSVIVTNDKVYSYSGDQSLWVDRGRLSTPQVSRRPLADLQSAFYSVDHAYASGLHVVVAVINSPSAGVSFGLWSMIEDESNGTIVRAWEELDNDSAQMVAHVFTCGTTAVVVYSDGANVKARTIDLSASNPSWSSSTNLATNLGSTRPLLDAQPVVGHANRFFIAYVSSTSLVAWSIWNCTSLGAPVFAAASYSDTSGSTGNLDGDGLGIGVHATDGDTQYWIVWDLLLVGGTTNRVRAITVTAADGTDRTTGNPVTVATVTSATNGILGRGCFQRVSASRAILFVSPNYALQLPSEPYTLIHVLDQTGTGLGSLSTIANTSNYWLGILSRPWVAPNTEINRVYIACQLLSSIQSTDFVCEIDTSDVANITRMQIAARFATRLAGFNGAVTAGEMSSYTISGVTNPQTGRYVVAHNVVVSGSGTAQRTQLWRTAVEWEPGTRHRGANYRQSLRIGGGTPQVFDGQRAYEEGFHWYPEIVSVSMAGSGGSLSAGTYLYAACYRFTLTSGEIVRSAPSPPVSAVAAASDLATVVVRSYTSGAMRGNYTSSLVTEVAIEIYRTQVGGQTFTLVSSGVLSSTYKNNPATASVSINDGEIDTNIATNLPLYTDGTPGPLENVCPPSLYPVVVHKGRLWGIDDSRRAVFYSDPSTPGEAPRWHEVQSIAIDEGEDLIGFLSTDQTIAVGTASKIFQLVGEPADRLGNGSLSYQPVASSCGMGSPFSASFDGGAIFQSGDGTIKLFDRGGSIRSMDQVLDQALANPFLSSIKNVPLQSEVRLSVAASSSASTGYVLAFDVLRQAWIKRGFYINDTANVALRDMWLVDGVCYFGQSNGQVFVESESVWTDDAVYVEMTMGLPWVSFGAIQGYQRCSLVRVLGDRHTAHDVEFSLYYDHSESATTTRTFGNATYGSLTLWQLDHTPARQKCQRFRVQVKTKTPTGGGSVGTGQGASWQSVMFKVEQYEGPGRVASGRRG